MNRDERTERTHLQNDAEEFSQFEKTETADAGEPSAATDLEILEGQKEPRKDLKKNVIGGAFDYLELFAWSVLAVLILFTFGIRLCRVDGESMENTLFDQQNLLLYSFSYEPKQGDIVVFHLTERPNMQKTLVKRVIAVGGQEVVIDTKTNTITVDGVPFDDSNAVFKNKYTDEITGKYDAHLFYKNYDSKTGIYKVIVPENHIFVLGDNRNNSADSRSAGVGFVDERCVLGKVIVRLSPFTVFS